MEKICIRYKNILEIFYRGILLKSVEQKSNFFILEQK